MAAWIWVLIPLAAIAVGGFSEWLKFRKETAQLGSSTSDLQDKVDGLTTEVQALRDERAALVRRVQNLEAIVTSEAWDMLGKDPALAQAKTRLPLLDDASPDAPEGYTARAEQLARRLRM